jgi:hypothetical protein
MQRIQLKVVVGQPGDKYEQEADSMAAQVMSMSAPPANSAPIQRQGEEEEQEPLVQRSSLADSITPLVQRQTEEQEEPLQAKSLLQRAGNGNAEQVVMSRVSLTVVRVGVVLYPMKCARSWSLALA